jgi:hypothetical protein
VRVWTVACKGPDAPASWSNSSPKRLDKICQAISTCPAAGGFGKFLQAVTFSCERKHFDGYFGLDGITFGILDWTSDNLPVLFQRYQARDKAKFEELFGPLNLPIKNGCLDPKWACENNQQGKLTCDARFNEAFAKGLRTAEFQKAQLDHALATYEKRISRLADFGLKTEYGNTAMAVLANNLRSSEACRPATWKKLCQHHADEARMVDCMLDQYVDHGCRGNPRNSAERRDAIKKVFAGAPPSENIHPKVDAIVACSSDWGAPPE